MLNSMLRWLLLFSFWSLLVCPAFAQSPSLPNNPTVNRSKLKIREISIVGCTVFSNERLAALTKPYVGKTVELNELHVIIQSVVQAIDRLYAQEGYISSGAYFPPQDLSEGTIQIQVVEGSLENLEINGLERLQDSYIRDRLLDATTPPLNVNRVQEALQRLQNNRLIASIYGEIAAGSSPHSRLLNVAVKETPPFSAAVQFDNYSSFTVGDLQGTTVLEHLNLLGWGDSALVQYNRTEGLEKFYTDYTIPLNSQDGTLKLSYEIGDSRIIIAPFNRFDLEGKTQKASLTWRQPIIQSNNNDLALSVGLDWQQNESFLLGQPFSFIQEVPDGTYRITALRLAQEWTHRSSRRVVALRSEFSLGLDLFDATVLDNESGLDGRFFLWRGQFQWTELITNTLLFVTQLSGQWTEDVLLPGERFQVGGIYTVRGYDRNFRTGDRGIAARVEFRYTPVSDRDWGTLTLSPFFDFGAIGDNLVSPLSPNPIASTGVSLQWQRNPFLLRLDYAEPLTETQHEQNLLFLFQLQHRF
jgi:hemolysin activation/secretion protein